jgi:hypothetical protein
MLRKLVVVGSSWPKCLRNLGMPSRTRISRRSKSMSLMRSRAHSSRGRPAPSRHRACAAAEAHERARRDRATGAGVGTRPAMERRPRSSVEGFDSRRAKRGDVCSRPFQGRLGALLRGACRDVRIPVRLKSSRLSPAQRTAVKQRPHQETTA